LTWVYEQASGKLLAPSTAEIVAIGYSGRGLGKNNPLMQNVLDRGPIPVGLYHILEPKDSVDHGPYVLGLEPAEANAMFGRTNFLIHGDSRQKPGMASKGCIILPRSARVEIWKSGDRWLQVTAGSYRIEPEDFET
jgi:hypothetical protein